MDIIQENLPGIEFGAYVPLSAFMHNMKHMAQLPYQTEISFEPFFRMLKQNLAVEKSDQSQMVKQALSEVEKDLTGQHCSVHDAAFAERLDNIMGLMMPSLMFGDNLSMITPPFVKQFVYKTPALKAFFASGNWEVKIDEKKFKKGIKNNTIQAAIFILNCLYGTEFPVFDEVVIQFRNIHTGLEKHYQLSLRLDFIEVVELNPKPKLSDKQIQELYDNYEDEALWLKYLPPSDFAFRGMAIGTFHDVTEIEVLSQLKGMVMDSERKMEPNEMMPFIQGKLRSYLDLPSFDLGFVGIVFKDFLGHKSFSLTGTNDLSFLRSYENLDVTGGAYCSIGSANEPMLFKHLPSIEQPSKGEQILIDKGYEDLILIPLRDERGKILSIFEMACKEKQGFNGLKMHRLDQIFDLLKLGNDRYYYDMTNRISQFIKQQFTSIHPSVEWKFEQVAADHEVRKTLQDFDGAIAPIVFKDVYPLYGQADIVSSSNLRNRSIQLDLIENLERVSRLMQIWLKHLDFHLLESYQLEAEAILTRLREEFMSSDETQVVDLLAREIHPLLRQLRNQYPQLPREPYEEYFEGIDANLDVVYEQRKRYEESVSRLNQTIGSFLEQDDARMQKILPHFFEKYSTDGVEYNIYLGQSLLPEGQFSEFYLKDFRLWQLVNTCELTRLVAEQSKEWPVPLTTAQLLFVYNSQLSIRFRMDEKQFDVDGTYNVRYEILKKRIDKAIVKGTDERLTQPGKIAIVYLQEKDRQEYLTYLEYLIRKGYITEEIEQLELEKLQGADGLKALRVTVVC